MCGIAGVLTSSNGHGSLADIAGAMSGSLTHRGPDDSGLWVDAEAGVALAHRRLSIIELSDAGHQPMVSGDGRYVMSYNGEVYSHEDMRPALVARGVKFRGRSDTEVILESIAAFGLEKTLAQLIGMFAFALWDRRERTLTLVRDRLGIKPVYWAKFGNLFLFGSELKALRQHPRWTPSIDREAVATFTRYNYIPAPHTIYRGVRKLEPGTFLRVRAGGEPQLERFWDAREIARCGLSNPLGGSDSELTDQLEAGLKDSIRRRMLADVPLGAFLSGGVDSSTVVALMQAADAGPVKTFTIGSDVPGFDEAPYAAAVARHLGTEHTELTVTARQALDVIPRMPEWFDEPFADASQVPTYLVSAMTRNHVTVALSGDGGDELFAGYNRYALARNIWLSLSLVPRAVRRGMAAMLTRVSPERWTSLFSSVPMRLPGQIGDKIHKAASVLALADGDAVYRRLITHWEPADVAPRSTELKGILWDPAVKGEFPDLLERMQFLDLVTYLPDDILTKVDRTSMAVALEARVPLLDHRVVEFAWRLPRRAKVRGATRKWLLRQVLYRHVPRELIERPKMGFSIPLGEWLRGPLRDWAESLLSEQRLREGDFFDTQFVRRYWAEHISGTRNWQYLLWGVLMFEAWRERWGRGVV
ncbi:MAG TPA: asparagine synthase (glutamine-hydrolyzing) [Pseudolabrys sp.]|nr:asparagine synthase (glutamine-hydrolyzing) [Pseudolabrys sp.]